MRSYVKRKAEHAASVQRVDDAIVPQARRCVVGVPLGLVLAANAIDEAALIRFRPGFAACLQTVASHSREHLGRLFATHDGDARVWPHPEEPCTVGATTHRVISSS